MKAKKAQTPLPQKPQNLSQIRKQMKDEKNQKPVTSSPKLSQTKQTNKANELANKAITKAGKEMKGFVKNLFGSDKKADQKSAEQSRTAGNKKPEQKHGEANKPAEQQKFVKPGSDMVIERTFTKPESDSTASSGQDKKGDVTMMKMIQQRLKAKPKPPQQPDQQSKQTNKQTKSEQKQIKKEQKKENLVPDAKRRASKVILIHFYLNKIRNLIKQSNP